MYSPSSPSTLVPISDNVLMDVDSDAEAEQAALELTQAQERLCVAKEAQESVRRSVKDRRRRERQRSWQP